MKNFNRYFIQKTIIAVGFLLLPFITYAQDAGALPYHENQVEPDQEMSPSGTATDKFKAVHIISTSLRGVRGANGVVYWVSKDKATLSTYKGAQLLWRADVAEAFKPDIQQPQIEKLVFASNVVFVFVSKRGFTEINRDTGQLGNKVIN
ncbi:hypothetical protein [Pontibacter liquoris]|uniref:hypothetical protein n=1 Tax=Pontibacter liquoris TaxID=2905677 RepID=UPI001FA7D1E9|nr:hypothetical protein [Pontibacter liquoris]